MSQQKIVVVQSYQKDVSTLFAALSDHNRLSDVFLIPVKRIRDGETELNGVGSVRRLGPWPLGVEETVTALAPDSHIEYRITRNGGPIKNHQGRIDFAATEQGCEVRWTIEFDAIIAKAGSVVATVLESGLKHGLRRLA